MLIFLFQYPSLNKISGISIKWSCISPWQSMPNLSSFLYPHPQYSLVLRNLAVLVPTVLARGNSTINNENVMGEARNFKAIGATDDTKHVFHPSWFVTLFQHNGFWARNRLKYFTLILMLHISNSAQFKVLIIQ